MEGFYYDAEIQHIAEIVKNCLYFAVLEGNANKVIRNSIDTCYFTIDDEMLYNNYYLDFGPLNISCLYKYCCKVNGYLQYARGIRRLVHYTTANPIKRVNAAFLIGCYSIMYFKMEPKEIYQILLTTGGQFKSYVDASQGVSQYTIKLLDCFQAIQKAITFNFFNFCDFNMEEYDTYDKVQNGDMNWLIPRKFIAFIGPTDENILCGHSPEFYIRYFLDNDVKTIIRLNNKLYDASVFTRAGIDHYELFFPDGTVPTKQILLQFLDLTETACAAIAVHCKAGLGRTGSLIGAYIIKHYHMTAREAIAWMRICRPGSVIGQQQGWLEKIEGWLWRQGGQYRLKHFGDGDKMPHHKYGIYSKEWVIEREKLIKHVQRKRYEAQAGTSRTKSKLKSESHSDRLSAISAKVPKKSVIKNLSYTQKPAVQVERDEEPENVRVVSNRLYKNSFSANHNRDTFKFQDIPSIRIKPLNTSYPDKRRIESNENSVKKLGSFRQKGYVSSASGYQCYEPGMPGPLDFCHYQEDKVPHVHVRRRNPSVSREYDYGNTQGDKLNEIKARRYANSIDSDEIEIKMKNSKHRRRLNNVTNIDMVNGKSKLISKKEERNTTKKSKFDRYYPSEM